MSLMHIHSRIRDYVVRFAEAPETEKLLLDIPNAFYVVDGTVWQLYSRGCLREIELVDRQVLPISEERKSLATVQELYRHLIQRSVKRNMTLVSIGGGVLQDISGFVASTLYRGVKWTFFPTTLLAQADSCIGGKTSLNCSGFKNLVGTFYPPHQIIIDVEFLKSQNDLDFYSGLGEVLKLHLIGGEATVSALVDALGGIRRRDKEVLAQVVRSSLEIKRDYITRDEFDDGVRNMLNFGHCFGHALESTSQYVIPHGQAVVLGMLLANIVARNRGLLDGRLAANLAEEFLVPGLACRPTGDHLNAAAVVEAMKHDKKRTGEGLAVVVVRDGWQMAKLDDVRPAEASGALGELWEVMAVEGKTESAV